MTLDPRRLGWVLRGGALVAVFGLAIAGFRAGVAVSDRPGLPNADLLTHIYYTAGLFVLGGLDLGTPVSGPAGARNMLWSAYFLAPLITTGAVVEGALRVVNSGRLERMRLRRHVVLVGLGRLAVTFVAALRKQDPRGPLVAIDRDAQKSRAVEARRQFGVRTFPGDARSPAALASFHLDSARAVALLTGDDLLNLELAYRLATQHPHLPIVAHVSDVGLQRVALEVERPGGSVRIFNAHRVVAEYLYRQYLEPYFRGTAPRDAVVLAGFGRLGQAILELLEATAAQAVATVVVLDQSAEVALRNFRDHVPASDGLAVRALDSDLGDIETWARVERALGSLSVPPVVVVATHSDSVNLQSALRARRRWPAAPVFMRCQDESAFAEQLAERRGFTVLAVNSMLKQALAQAQQEWFGSAERRSWPASRQRPSRPGSAPKEAEPARTELAPASRRFGGAAPAKPLRKR